LLDTELAARKLNYTSIDLRLSSLDVAPMLIAATRIVVEICGLFLVGAQLGQEPVLIGDLDDVSRVDVFPMIDAAFTFKNFTMTARSTVSFPRLSRSENA
jgi:hypothetical protein